MLVLVRRKGEKVTITTPSGEVIIVECLDGNKIGFTADRKIRIERDDIKAGAK